MEILAEEAHNRLVMIECFADHCAISHGFANVVADICDMFPKLVFMQINKMDRYNGHKMFECLKVGKFRDPRAAARGKPRFEAASRESGGRSSKTELDASGTRRARPARRHTKYKTPTYMFFRNGEQIDEVVGANQPEIERIIKKHIDWDPNAPPEPDSDSEEEATVGAAPEVVEDDDQE